MIPLLEYARQHVAATIDTIERLVAIESPSTDKAAVDRCGRELAQILRAGGADVDTIPQQERGDHLRARWGGGERPVLILGHFDTVWPIGTLTKMPLKRDGHALYGPGTFDMKAGIGIGMVVHLRHGMRLLRAGGGIGLCPVGEFACLSASYPMQAGPAARRDRPPRASARNRPRRRRSDAIPLLTR